MVIKKHPPVGLSLFSFCLHQEEQCLCYCIHHPACSLLQRTYKFNSQQVSDTTIFWTNNLQWWEPSEFETHSFLLLAQTSPVTNHVRTDVFILWHTSLLRCLKPASIANVFETCTVTLKQSVLFFYRYALFFLSLVLSAVVWLWVVPNRLLKCTPAFIGLLHLAIIVFSTELCRVSPEFVSIVKGCFFFNIPESQKQTEICAFSLNCTQQRGFISFTYWWEVSHLISKLKLNITWVVKMTLYSCESSESPEFKCDLVWKCLGRDMSIASIYGLLPLPDVYCRVVYSLLHWSAPL